MKIFISILFPFLYGIQVYSQTSDTLISSNDTTFYQLMVKQKSGEYKVFFKTGISIDWNEVYPEYANVAFSEKYRYISIKLPDTESKVWAKCLFSGDYQLLEYNHKFYINGKDNIYKLTSPENDITDFNKKTQRTLFIGQMIAIFNSSIDFDYKKLQYSPKSLVQPLIKYHEQNNLPYRDYNDYYPAHIDLALGLTGGIETMRLNLQTEEFLLGNEIPVDYTEFFPTISAEIKLNIPKLSKRLYFTGGVELSKHNIDVYSKINSESTVVYYSDLQYDAMSLAFPVNMGFEILKNDVAVVAIQTELKPFFIISSEAQMKLESEYNNIINTEFITVNENNVPELFHNIGLKICSPVLSKKLTAGIGYSYSLTPSVDEINSITHINSLTFSILLSF